MQEAGNVGFAAIWELRFSSSVGAAGFPSAHRSCVMGYTSPWLTAGICYGDECSVRCRTFSFAPVHNNYL